MFYPQAWEVAHQGFLGSRCSRTASPFSVGVGAAPGVTAVIGGHSIGHPQTHRPGHAPNSPLPAPRIFQRPTPLCYLSFHPGFSMPAFKNKKLCLFTPKGSCSQAGSQIWDSLGKSVWRTPLFPKHVAYIIIKCIFLYSLGFLTNPLPTVSLRHAFRSSREISFIF